MPEPAQPPADLLPVQRKATLAYRAIRLWAVPLLRTLFRITVEGRERMPTSGAYVLIANHLNWLDSFAILASFPEDGESSETLIRAADVAMYKVKSRGGDDVERAGQASRNG